MPLLRPGWVPLSASGAQLQQPVSQHQQEAKRLHVRMQKVHWGQQFFIWATFVKRQLSPSHANLLKPCQMRQHQHQPYRRPGVTIILCVALVQLCSCCMVPEFMPDTLHMTLLGHFVAARVERWRERECGDCRHYCGEYTLARQLRSSNIIKKGIKSSREIAFLHLDCIRIF